MELAKAIQTLQDLVGRPVNVKLDGRMKGVNGPIRVIAIDFFADRERRCIVGGGDGAEASFRTIRRPVVDITYERRFTEADATIAAASKDDLRAAVDQMLGENHRTG